MKEFKGDPFYDQFIEPILRGKECMEEKYVWPKSISIAG